MDSKRTQVSIRPSYSQGLHFRQIAWAMVTPLFLLATSVHATTFPGVLNGAIDQPRINIIARPGPDAVPLSGTTLDFFTLEEIPTYNIEGFFDTGASSVLLADLIVQDFDIPKEQGWGFVDAGVAGSEHFGITEPLYVQLGPKTPSFNLDNLPSPNNPSDPVNNDYFNSHYNHVYPPLRAITSQPSSNTGSIFDDLLSQMSQVNVLGMPLFHGKTVVMDSRGVNSVVLGDVDLLDLVTGLTISTYAYDSANVPPFNPSSADSNPGIPPTNLHIRTSYASFDDFTNTTGPGAQPPTLAHNPFIGPNPLSPSGQQSDVPGVTIEFNGSKTTSSILFDTGGAATIFAQHLIQQLGVQYRHGAGTNSSNPILEYIADGSTVPNQFQLTLGGVGGQVKASGLFLDSLLVRTMEGDAANDNDLRHLQYTDVPVLVLDISIEHPVTNELFTLDGIFGMNLLFPTAFVDEPLNIFDLQMAPGFYDWITFDEPSGLIGLQFNDLGNLLFNSQFPGMNIPGDANLDGRVDITDLAIWGTHAYMFDQLWMNGDFNFDGKVGIDDLGIIGSHWGQVASQNTMVPEPAALSVLCAGFICIGRRRRRP